MNDLNIFWAVPFFATLLIIALFPILCHKVWDKHSFKILLVFPIILSVVIYSKYGESVLAHEIAHALLVHYIPLMALLFSLFTVTGGINIKINLQPTTLNNSLVLLTGSMLAGWIGTTGASMLLIRPLLSMNASRKHLSHIVIFFIFTVSNIGGVLTPLGDPPLFMGFISGVDFFWTVKNLWLIMILTLAFLISIFVVIDTFMLKKENFLPSTNLYDNKISINGFFNIFLLVGIVSLIILSANIDLGELNILGVDLKITNLVKDVLLFFIALISLYFTSDEIKKSNHFTFDSFKEVVEIFLAIFITLIPIIKMLHMGINGPFSSIFKWTINDGALDPFRIFWACGLLSSFLDNAPTYLLFFHLSGGDAISLMESKIILTSISVSAVFMGAVTYIGNAPNIMIKSIAVENKINMPNFFGYIVWSCLILLPLFLFLSVLLF